MFKITNNTNQTFQLLGGEKLKPFATLIVDEINVQLETLKNKGIISVKKV